MTSNRKKAPTFRPRLEVLEDRIVPVVVAYADPPTPVPLTSFTGVVETRAAPAFVGDIIRNGTASLFRSDQTQGFDNNLITAAHVLSGEAVLVDVTLSRGGNAVPIRFVVPPNLAGNKFQYVHPGYQLGQPVVLNDVAVLKLIDQSPLADPNPNRFLVMPFGASKYELYAENDEAGKNVVVVGFGMVGNGSQGAVFQSIGKTAAMNTIDADDEGLKDEIQRIDYNGNDDFFVRFDGVDSSAIPGQNATAAQVQAALESLLSQIMYS